MEKTVAILTNMMDFNPGYSLTGIIYDQTKMLVRRGHKVLLFVNEQFNPEGMDFSHVELKQEIPFSHLTDYQSLKNFDRTNEDPEKNHELIAKLTADILVDNLKDVHVVFTHDFIFTGWFIPYGIGCKMATSRLPNTRFYHWIHSIPSGYRDYWSIKSYGPSHKIVFPNETDALRVAEQFKGELSDVRVVPHIKDIRTWSEFSEETCRLIDLMPSVLDSEIMQVYPAGTDRLHAKGVDKVIKIFGALKHSGAKVCLLIANQWATGRQRKQTIGPYVDIARTVGLTYAEDFAFTSDLHPEWGNGLSRTMVRELFNCSNLFVFPTHEESFGLVLPEAVLSSAILPVLNASLSMQREVVGLPGNALWFDFGSFEKGISFGDVKQEIKFYEDIAAIVISRLRQNESIRSRTWAKQYYNMDYLFDKVYNPLIKGEDYIVRSGLPVGTSIELVTK